MRHLAAIAPALLVSVALAGCVNPDAARTPSEQELGSPGEPAAPSPTPPGSEPVTRPAASAQEALAAFAEGYVNWSYATLAAVQRRLAASAVGAARTAERQALVSTRADPTIDAGRIRNSGSVVSVAAARGQPGMWVIVTREQTSGSGGYEGLPAAYHVTLARVAHLRGGYAVSEWLPQS
jgi:hypothetical protein